MGTKLLIVVFAYLILIFIFTNCDPLVEDELPRNNPVDMDGNVYRTVKIGKQEWMVENLETTKYNDGVAIQFVPAQTEWKNSTSPAYCWYANDELRYKETFGALYNWHAVSTGKLCPTGWHVPSEVEWKVLSSHIGGDSLGGGILKEAGFINWIEPNTGASNQSGFSALPGGYRDAEGWYFHIGEHGLYWSSTEKNATNSWRRFMFNSGANFELNNENKTFGYSVRCLKD